MNSLSLALEGVWKVLAAGLVLGAGLPVVFALGVRALAFAEGGEAEDSHAEPHPIGRVLAVICFAVVAIGIILGITYIVASGFGKTISFEHVWPTIVDKH
ncbi:conserved exported hypothetical protein [Nostocoides japonicum T1-X7]|uniref:Uncharacterized protein n=1 Tax=Nostocoides japonicum T1-X7 TaxID=1194083 RepID=A0A077LW84_9MICO|nr:hypothetical protein [Tetrasphaera japonica]CCH77991.1 conserved exported hypothetical protein [Tetrasphaera japonica T1-X7]